MQLHATITELQTQRDALDIIKQCPAGCPQCALPEQGIQQDKHIADLQQENSQLKKLIAEQNRRIAEQCGHIVVQDRLIDDLRLIDNLQQPSRKMQKIVRRIAVIKAKHNIIQRIGRSIDDMTWNEYHASLTTHEKVASGVESPAIWRKLASWNKLGNEASHVASKGEVAEAICAAQEGMEAWYSIFDLAYGEYPKSLGFDE